MDGKLRSMTTVFLERDGKILMLYRQGGRVVSDVWVGSAGGHFLPDELSDARACVLRELHEELGLCAEQLEGLRLRYITLRQTKGEIRQNYYFFARLCADVDEALTSTEGSCRWFRYAELPSLEMPFTAQYVIAHYLREGMQNDILYGGIATAADVVFTAM